MLKLIISEDDLKEDLKEDIYKEMLKAMKWHKKTFKDAKIGEQLLKLEEEAREMNNEIGNDSGFYKEMADVLIVISGLCRWESQIGLMILGDFMERADIEELIKVRDAMRAKMKINRARKWTKLKDGRFKHVEKGKK